MFGVVWSISVCLVWCGDCCVSCGVEYCCVFSVVWCTAVVFVWCGVLLCVSGGVV